MAQSAGRTSIPSVCRNSISVCVAPFDWLAPVPHIPHLDMELVGSHTMKCVSEVDTENIGIYMITCVQLS